MSEAAANDAAVAPAEATTPVPDATPTPAEATPADVGRKDRNELRGEVRARAKERWSGGEAAPEGAAGDAAVEGGAAGEAPQAGGQPRDEQGKFTKADAAAPEGAAHADSDTSSRTEAVPEGFVRVELPEGHDWRRGDITSAVVPVESEQLFRAAMNQPTRRREVEDLASQLREAQGRAIAAEVRAEFKANGKLDPMSDPETAKMLEELRKGWPEKYETVKASLEQNSEALVEREVQQRLGKVRDLEATAGFFQEIQGPELRQHFGLWNDQEYVGHVQNPSNLEAYAAQVDLDRTRNPDAKPTLKGYADFLQRHYVNDPQVIARFKQREQQRLQTERERIAAEARAQAERDLAAQRAAETSSRHRPVRGVSALTGRAAPTTAPVVDPNPPAPERPTSPSDIKRHGREAARAAARELYDRGRI